jgi:hypothetical protein
MLLPTILILPLFLCGKRLVIGAQSTLLCELELIIDQLLHQTVLGRWEERQQCLVHDQVTHHKQGGNDEYCKPILVLQTAIIKIITST